MKNSRQVNIAGYDVVLTERVAEDTRDVEDFFRARNFTIPYSTDITVKCAEISDSLKQTKRAFKFWQIKKILVYKKVMNVKFLRKNLSENEILNLRDIIDEIEETEKKKSRLLQMQPELQPTNQ